MYTASLKDRPLTLQDIKDMYYVDLAIGVEARGFEQYLERFERVYDVNLNFIGYELK